MSKYLKSWPKFFAELAVVMAILCVGGGTLCYVMYTFHFGIVAIEHVDTIPSNALRYCVLRCTMPPSASNFSFARIGRSVYWECDINELSFFTWATSEQIEISDISEPFELKVPKYEKLLDSNTAEERFVKTSISIISGYCYITNGLRVVYDSQNQRLYVYENMR